jgi:biopolymer transport protein ExbB
MPDLLGTLVKGGYMMVPLLACSVFAIAVLLDRLWAFMANHRVDIRSLRSNVLKLLGQGKLEQAADLCANTPGPVSAVLLVGLKSYDKHRRLVNRPESLTSVMEKAMNDYAAHAMSAVEKRLNVLATIGAVAPLLGMTGTVTGMITSFDELAEAGGMDQGGKVMAGIAEALITTATGLIIALFGVVPYTYFTGEADKVDLQIQEATTELLDYVATRLETSEHAASNE